MKFLKQEQKMHLYLPVAVILISQGLFSDRNVLSYETVPFIERRNTKNSDWKVISSLTNRAYSQYDLNKAKGQKLFEQAAAKMEAYLKKYETNPEQLSYLRGLVHLGALYQNADNYDKARTTFEQCERHREFKSSSATLNVTVDGTEIRQTIAEYVGERLCFLTDCKKPEHKAAGEVVQRRSSGSSRGAEFAPPFSIPGSKERPQNRPGGSKK